jgi:4-amino-4-deoxy-L-arabinose transferase-like glycosyltransferase
LFANPTTGEQMTSVFSQERTVVLDCNTKFTMTQGVSEEIDCTNKGEVPTMHVPTPPHSLTRAAIWLVVVAFAIRMAFVLGLQTYLFDRIDDVSRFNETTYIAWSIADGRGFSSPFGPAYTGPTAWIPPIYPYFCALIFHLTHGMDDRAWLIIFTLQCLFSSLTVIPILGIAQFTVGRRPGLWAAAVWAIFPWFSKWSVTWVYETSLSALLVALLFWYTLYAERTSGFKTWAGFGALWGFALLLNPALLTLCLVAHIWLIYVRSRQKQQWLRLSLLSLAACLVVLSPWLVRNRSVLGHWIFVRSNFGAEFALGNHHLSLGRGEGPHPSTSAAEMMKYQQMGEYAYVREKNREAMAFIHQYPGEFAFLTAKRVVYFWDGSAGRYRPPNAWYWLPWSFGPLSLLLLPAFWAAYRTRIHALWLFVAAFLFYPAPYYLVFSTLRYRHVLEPLLLLLVAHATYVAARACSGAVIERRSNHPHFQPGLTS